MGVQTCTSLPLIPSEAQPIQLELELKAGPSREGAAEVGTATSVPDPVLSQM